MSCTPVRGRRMGSQMAPLVTSSSTLKLIPPAGDITFLSEEIVTDGDIGRHETCDVLWIARCSCDPKCVGFLKEEGVTTTLLVWCHRLEDTINVRWLNGLLAYLIVTISSGLIQCHIFDPRCLPCHFFLCIVSFLCPV